MNYSGIWGACKLKEALEKEPSILPDAQVVPRSTQAAPYVIVGDEGFGLKPYLMRPHPAAELSTEKRLFNYSDYAKAVRNLYTNYFVNEGQAAGLIFQPKACGVHYVAAVQMSPRTITSPCSLRESGLYEKLEKLVQDYSYTIYSNPAYPLCRHKWLKD
ncbi:hypothetical protein HPB47_014285 [Ixodes persulcatus]|uniref:Uncharacterized protein n=1 Tax=Ixodes persulcatus TaxID=34615 RepID=A0AC60QZZ1_IXOPE|nr:hypothetical protein HPB47_014285 [Ixodes persulcatus]